MKKIQVALISIILLCSIGCDKKKSKNGDYLSLLLLSQPVSTSGTINSSFGTDGITQINPSSYTDSLKAIGQQSSGKIILAGSNYIAFPTASYSFMLYRYNLDGSIDTSFDTDGMVKTDISSDTEEKTYGMAIQQDDKIVLVGSSYNSTTSYDIVVIRCNADGTLDNTFGTNGVVKTNTIDAACFGNCGDYGNAVAIATDGKIIVAGTSKSDIILLRYTTGGVLDSTFNTTGYKRISISTYVDKANAMALQADGKIILVGQAGADAAIIRINSDGSLDNTFGTNGAVIQDFHASSDYYNDVAIQPDGKIIAVGNGYYYGDYDMILRRYNSDGTTDTTFNGGQWLYAGVNGMDDNCTAVKLQPDGKIVAGGGAYYDTSGKNSFIVFRVNSDGTPDYSFGNGSFFFKTIGNFTATVTDILILSDKSILAAGEWNDANSMDTALAVVSILP